VLSCGLEAWKKEEKKKSRVKKKREKGKKNSLRRIIVRYQFSGFPSYPFLLFLLLPFFCFCFASDQRQSIHLELTSEFYYRRLPAICAVWSTIAYRQANQSASQPASQLASRLAS